MCSKIAQYDPIYCCALLYVKYFQTFLINLISSGWNTYCTDCDCLDPNATGPTSPTTTAAPPPEPTTASPPTTTEPPTGCGSPQYNDDQWCDDDNNNAGCNYDGGACCDNNFSGMNANSRSQL